MSGQVGIDIGHTAVRVVKVSGLTKQSYAHITHAASVPLPHGAVMGGQIKDEGVVIRAVRSALKEAGCSGYGAIVGITSPLTAVRVVKLPSAVRPHERESALRENNITVSPLLQMNKTALALQHVSDVTEGDAENSILLAAATNAVEVEEFLDCLRAAKVIPRAVDLSGAATLRALVRLIPDTRDVVTLVDIGASKTTIVTRQGDQMRSLKTIEHGGENVTAALMGVLGVDRDRAEATKLSMRWDASASAGPAMTKSASEVGGYGDLEESSVHDIGGGGDDNDKALQALHSAGERLADAIAKAIESDTSAHPSAPTAGVQLAGGCSQLPGLREQISAHVGVPVQAGRPWATVGDKPSRKVAQALVIDGAEDPVALLEMATAIGLALWNGEQ